MGSKWVPAQVTSADVDGVEIVNFVFTEKADFVFNTLTSDRVKYDYVTYEKYLLTFPYGSDA